MLTGEVKKKKLVLVVERECLNKPPRSELYECVVSHLSCVLQTSGQRTPSTALQYCGADRLSLPTSVRLSDLPFGEPGRAVIRVDLGGGSVWRAVCRRHVLPVGFGETINPDEWPPRYRP